LIKKWNHLFWNQAEYKYWIDEMLDDDQQEEIYDYFMESATDQIEAALKEFEGDYDTEELRLMRIKFILKWLIK
jgi:ATP-dependent DNA helicase RecQ